MRNRNSTYHYVIGWSPKDDAEMNLSGDVPNQTVTHTLLVSEGCGNLISRLMFVIHNSPELVLATFLQSATYCRDASGTVLQKKTESFVNENFILI